MWPDGAWRETCEEYWKAGCSLRIRMSRNTSWKFQWISKKVSMDFQESFRWISNLESIGSCPTTPLPLTVSSVPAIMNSTLNHNNYILMFRTFLTCTWKWEDPPVALSQLHSCLSQVFKPKKTEVQHSTQCQIKKSHLMQYRHQNTLFCWFSLKSHPVSNYSILCLRLICTPVWIPCRKVLRWPWCPLSSLCAHRSARARGGSRRQMYKWKWNFH